MDQELYAFWEYSIFPYTLGGVVTKILDNGKVETEGFGPGAYFTPYLIVPKAAGLLIHERLRKLEAEHTRELRNFHTDWKRRIAHEIPELKEKQ